MRTLLQSLAPLRPARRRSSVPPWSLAVLLVAAVIANEAASAPTPDEDGARPREQFVPAEQFDAVFSRDGRGVLMPRAEFEDLLQQADRNIRERNLAPVPIVVEQAQLTVEPGEYQAVITAVLSIRQFDDGWQILQIPGGNLQLEKAELGDGTPAIIARNDSNPSILQFAGSAAGRTQLILTMSTSVASVGSDRAVGFQLPQIPSTTLIAGCPAGQQLMLNDLELSRPTPEDEAAEYRVPVGAADQVRLRWTDVRRESESQTLVFVRSDTQLQVQKESLRWSADSRVSVFGGSINQVIARVPSQLEITSVESSGLESWVLADDPDAAGTTRVTLTFRQPFSNDRLVRFQGVAAVSADRWQTVPTLEFVDVTSHAGRVLVTHEAGLRLTADTGSGIRQIRGDELDAAAAGLSVFDFWLQQFELRVAVKPRDQELFSELNSGLAISDTTAAYSATVTVETLNAPLFELPLTLPADWHLSQLSADDVAVDWRQGGDPTRIIVVPATPVPQDGLLRITLQLQRSIPDPETEQRLDLPFVIPENTTVVGGLYVIQFAADLTVSPVTVTGLTPMTGTGSQLVFRKQSGTLAGEIAVIRRTPQLTSRSELRTWSDTRQQTLSAAMTIDVINGTARELTIELPEGLGENVRFDVVGTSRVPGFESQLFTGGTSIAEQTPLDPVDGMRPFLLKLHNRFAGSLMLKAFVQQSITEGEAIAAPVVRVRGAVRQHGVLVFEASPEQQLEPSVSIADLDGVFEADPAVVEAPSATTGRRIALTYRFVKPEYSFSVSRTRFNTEAVPSAVCETMTTECLLNETGSVQQLCTAAFRLSGVQTLRFTLPESGNAFLWSTMLNGDPVEVRRDNGDYLVAVPRQSDHESLTLEILFESSAQRPDALGRVEQYPVAFAIDVGDAASAPVDILKQWWVMRYPESTALVESDGPFRAVNGTDQPGWVRRTLSGDLPTFERMGMRLLPVAMIATILFVITALIHRRRWKTMAGLALAGIPAALLLMQLNIGDRAMTPAFETAAMRMFDAEKATPQSAVTDGAVRYRNDIADGMVRGGEFGGYDESMAAPEAGMGLAAGGRALPGSGAGGMGGGGFGGGMGGDPTDAPAPPAGPPTIERGFSDPFGAAPQAESAAAAGRPAAPATAAQEPTLAVPDVALGGLAQQVPRFSGQAADTEEDSAPARTRKGAARLSVRVDLQTPRDYQARSFLSVGDAIMTPGVLSIVVQDEELITALRLTATLLVLVICWFMRSASLVARLAALMILLTAAAAAVPLAANRWQSILDGVIIGCLAGGVLWLVSAAFAAGRWITNRVRSGGRWWRRKRVAAAATLSLCVLLPATDSFAQETESPSLRPDVVVPYSPDQPALRANQVFVSHDEFLKLFRAAYPDALPGGERNPLGTGVVAAFCQGGDFTRVDAERSVLRVRARYVISCDSETTVRIPVPLGAVGIASATLDDQPATLDPLRDVPLPQPNVENNQPAQQQAAQQERRIIPPQQQAAYSVLVKGIGLHVLNVEFDVPAEIKEESGSVDLPLLPVASGSLELTVPLENADIRVNGRTTGFRRNGSTITLPIASAGRTRIQWQPDTRRDAGDIVFHSQVVSAIAVTDSGTTLRSTVSVNVRQGEVSEVDIDIPDDYAIQLVTGQDVAGWETVEDVERRVKLQLRRAVTDSTAVTITLFRDLRIETDRTLLEMPLLQVRGATRDTGTITLLTGEQFQVRSDSLSGVTQINPQEAPLPEGDELPGRRMLAWRYTRHPAAASVSVSRTAVELFVTDLHAAQLEEQRQRWASRYFVRISGAARSRIDIRIPESFLVLDVTADGMTDWYVDEGDAADGGTRLISIQLNAAREGSLDIAVHGQRDRDADRGVMTLQPPEIVGATRRSGQLAVWLDSASENAGVDAGGWTVRPVQSLHAQFSDLEDRPADVALQTNELSPATASIQLRKAVPTMLAESVTVTTATDTSIEMTLALNWQVTRAASDTFVVDLPTPIATALNFDVPNHRRTRREDLDNGFTRLTFELQQPVNDRLFVLGIGSLPLPDDGLIRPQPPVFGVAADNAATLAGQSHFWVLVNQSGGLLTPTGDPEATRVATSQLSTSIPTAFLQQNVSIQRLNDQTAAWRLEFPVQHQVTPAVVTLASHITVLSDDGSWRSQHVLEVRNESRQFLPVEFPDGARLMYCHVDGRPTRVVRNPDEGENWHLIPIPQSGLSAAAFQVEFAIAGRFGPGAATIRRDWQSRRLEIPVPKFPEFRDNEELGISVSRNRWSVYVPESWLTELVDDPRLTNVEPAEEDELEDVSLRSVLEQANSIMSAAQSAKGDFIRGKMLRELQAQRDVLNSMFGNEADVESERQQVLSKLGEITDQYWSREDSRRYEQVLEEGLELGQSGGSNLYLMEQDLNQNAFNALGNTEFLRSNRGIPFDDDLTAEPETEQLERFRFSVPEKKSQVDRLKELEERGRDAGKAGEGAGEFGNTGGMKSEAVTRRSRLLDRRQLNENAEGRFQDADKAAQPFGIQSPDQIFDAAAPMDFFDSGIGGNLQQNRALGIQRGSRGDPFAQDGQAGGGAIVPAQQSAEPMSAAEQVATGTLSLVFEIPTDGYRLDFVRTGGNATLSLDARASESVGLGLGLLWAAGCVVGAIMLIVAARRHSGPAFLRLLALLTAIAGVVGFVLLPEPANSVFLLVAAAAAVTWCVSFLVSSFRETPAAAS